MVKQLFISLVFLCFHALQAYGYTVNPNKEIDNYFTAITYNESYNLSSDIIANADPKKILRLANSNINSANAAIRYNIIDLIRRKSFSLTDQNIRRQYAAFLIQCIKDTDSGNSGVAIRSLTKFDYRDFTTIAKDSLYALLTKKTYHYEHLVRLAGFLHIEKARILLNEKLINDSTLTGKETWVYHLALARMGESASIGYCMNKVKSILVNDKTVTYIYPDMVYTKQPELILIALDQILSDDKNCNSPNPETDDNIICAFKIMEIVAPVIKNFPVTVDKYGEMEIDNYDETLAQVRNWITSNTEFDILNEIY